MAKPNNTIFKTGFDVKPASISSIGVVTFTDGTNELQPNQLQCEAYGYTYNKATGTCSAFKYNTNLNRSFSNENNSIQGTGNSTETGTNNTYIMGEFNTVKGFSRNNIIVGNQNEIANGINNANVFGTLGEATVDNSIVLGGNAADDLLGERQVTTLMNGVQTTDGSTIDSYLNNGRPFSVTNRYYAIPENTACYFQADILALRVGGSAASGAVGDFKSWVERGVVINKSGTLSISRSRTSPASSGTTGSWSPVSTVSGTNYVLTVTGKADMTLEWVASIRFTQIKTSVAL